MEWYSVRADVFPSGHVGARDIKRMVCHCDVGMTNSLLTDEQIQKNLLNRATILRVSKEFGDSQAAKISIYEKTERKMEAATREQPLFRQAIKSSKCSDMFTLCPHIYAQCSPDICPCNIIRLYMFPSSLHSVSWALIFIATIKSIPH
jgi:hypothetical protein